MNEKLFGQDIVLNYFIHHANMDIEVLNSWKTKEINLFSFRYKLGQPQFYLHPKTFALNF